MRGKRYLVHDRDPLFSEAFRAILRAAGIKYLKLPAVITLYAEPAGQVQGIGDFNGQ